MNTKSNSRDGLLWARWLFLRALGLIFFSAFYSLALQIHGLIGERGILPAHFYLYQLRSLYGPLEKIWQAPTLFWISTSDIALTAVVAAGLLASLLLVLNVWPRLTVGLCTILFLSCIGALQDFSSYQSDGMLLEAGVLSVFFAPRGVRPGLGATDPASGFSLFMLRWEWFRIYFESGLVKLLSGDVHWRNLTAMDDYYQNGPLPSWMGWYVQQLPHWYHAGTVVLTLFVELVLVWALFLPRRFRIACFVIVTALQIGIITTANYAFLNYLVLALGVLLLDDRSLSKLRLPFIDRVLAKLRLPIGGRAGGKLFPLVPLAPRESTPRFRIYRRAESIMLGILFYATISEFLLDGSPSLLAFPNRMLRPFRIANAYGLFAIMTPARYEIEFQGSNDGQSWISYPFRYKPQDPMERPGFYAPYQPRFDWNLWFASLGNWRESGWVVLAQERLAEGSPSVLRLFRSDPFHGEPPSMVRTVLWQYWFTDLATKRATGAWWRRQELGPYAGMVVRGKEGPVFIEPSGRE